MSSKKGVIPREGITADPIVRLIKNVVFNPALTLPLLLLARYTQRGQALALEHGDLVRRVRYLFYLGLVRWTSGFLSRGAVNNWRTDDTYRWDKEVVVVTGGSDGIGKLVVKLLAERGVKVAVLDVQPLTYDAPANVAYYRCDVTSVEAVAAAAGEIRSSMGHPTILINNAGVARGKTILDSSEADVRLTFDVNALSHYWLVKEFLPDMVSNDHGMVVTVASIAAYVCTSQMVDYSSSKAAALSFHEGLATELKSRYNAPKVRTVLITQGYTKTPLFKGFGNNTPMLIPDLEVESVAEAIVDKVMAGKSGQVVLPGISGFVAGMRWFPHWMQLHFRNDSSKLMAKWDGRQVIDAEAKYARKRD
ncbi:MAG: hypothetical protein M1832_001500 [Thelocarpon impressellum]|nr:MAG: hypothetical protein M1832_001500 [Thelocarpon impressellum]